MRHSLNLNNLKALHQYVAMHKKFVMLSALGMLAVSADEWLKPADEGPVDVTSR
jgi:hypothetical protein